MGLAARTHRLVACLLATLCLVGCGSESSIPIRDVRLDVAGHETPLTLPARFDAYHGAARPFSLRARVSLPPGFRDRPLSLVVPNTPGLADAVVNGRALLPIDGVPRRSVSVLPTAYPVPADVLVSGVANVELRFAPVMNQPVADTWIPRLSLATRGDRTYRIVRAINDLGSYGGAFMLLTIGLVHGIVFALDRRRREHGWFGAFAVGGAVLTIMATGLCEPWFGGYTLNVAWIVAIVAGLFAARFYHAYFGWRAPRAIWAAVVPLSVAWIFYPDAMRSQTAHARLASVGGAIALSFVLLPAIRAVRAKIRGGLVLLIAISVFIVLATPDILAAGSLADLLGGVRLLGLAYVFVTVMTSVLLARDHRDLRLDLERRVREVDLANTELRRQIAERSRELSEALGKLGALPAGGGNLAKGQLIDGRFVVERQLGQGAMGTVYEVRRRSDDQHFAMKIVSGASTGAALARFAREAQIAAGVAHRNVLSVTDVGIADSGVLFVVMEFVDGGSLEEQRSRFGDREWATAILSQIVEGVRALHRADVVHRDLKPGNVLVGKDGTIRVSDFGISALKRQTAVDVLAATHDVDGSLTAPGVLMGTPVYMAPELAHGAERASAASDVFALGIMAYEMLTGRAPYAVPPVLDALAGRISTPPAPPTDGILDAVIVRAMSFDARTRPSLDEWAAACRTV